VRRLLLNPGPTNVPARVRAALDAPDACHRTPEFAALMTGVQRRLLALAGGSGTHAAVLFAASGSGANEAMLGTLARVPLFVVNGTYSERLWQIGRRQGLAGRRLDVGADGRIEPGEVAAALARWPDVTHLVVVHHETTTGVLAPLGALGRIAERWGKPLLVDAISSLGAEDVDLQRDGIACCTVSANKCLEAFPGVSFALVREDLLADCEGRASSFYFDLHATWLSQREGAPRFTAPVQLVAALDEALRALEEEGVANRGARYRALSERLRSGLRALGLAPVLVPDPFQASTVTRVRLPAGVAFEDLRQALAGRGITVVAPTAALDAGCFLLAVMGDLDELDVDRCLHDLDDVLRGLGRVPATVSHRERR
jgi:2-aminoethylphosphonate-pyruvate transaminase